MNRPDLTQLGRNDLWWLISRKVYKIRTWNFNTIFIQVFNLCDQNLESVSLIVWKLYAFWQCSNFGNFQQFFYDNFRLRWKIWMMMVESERSSWDFKKIYLILNNLKIYFFIYKINFRWKMRICRFFAFMYKLLPKISDI